MADYETHEHDVLVIGSGGAGLRAAIEASAGGARVGLVCKCLLGKAHTVMAEGGIAAALANVDERDSWKVHFADTMRGGQYVNNWRMAQLHAQEAPARVKDLEAWGAVFDRTRDGRILQRNFGGHKYPRLAHVGDRTGLEMIRTLQDHGIHQGIDVYMECTVIRLLKDGYRISGASGYSRERGRFVLFKAKAVVLACIAFVVTFAAALIAFFLGQFLLSSTHDTATLSQPNVLRAVIGSAVYVTTCGLFAYAAGAILRHTAAAISSVIGLLFVVPILAHLLPRLLPFQIGATLSQLGVL